MAASAPLLLSLAALPPSPAQGVADAGVSDAGIPDTDGHLQNGGPGYDRLHGSAESDQLYGFGGDDVLQGRGGPDQGYGGDGNDMIAGGADDDQLWGEAGEDVLYGGTGDDRLDGGAGDDRLQGNSGDDWINLSLGNDEIDGGTGHDSVDARAVAQLLPSDDGCLPPDSLPPAIKLSYQIDLIPTPGPDKRQIQLIPQDSLMLSFDPPQPSASATSLGLLSSASSPSTQQQLRDIEAILAPDGADNSIDFSFTTTQRFGPRRFGPRKARQTPNITLDLSTETLAYGDQQLTIQGFQHATGSFGDDKITGNEHRNRLFGGPGKDQLNGGAGDDLLISHGRDRLTGGPGSDCFQLNAAWRKKIWRDKSRPQGIKPVQITDFEAIDYIHLESVRTTTATIKRDKSIQFFPFADLTQGTLREEQFWVMDSTATTTAPPSSISPGSVSPGSVSPNTAPLDQTIGEQVRLIYDAGSGELFYRGPEVFGGLDNWMAIAQLEGAPSLSAANFWVI